MRVMPRAIPLVYVEGKMVNWVAMCDVCGVMMPSEIFACMHKI